MKLSRLTFAVTLIGIICAGAVRAEDKPDQTLYFVMSKYTCRSSNGHTTPIYVFSNVFGICFKDPVHIPQDVVRNDRSAEQAAASKCDGAISLSQLFPSEPHEGPEAVANLEKTRQEWILSHIHDGFKTETYVMVLAYTGRCRAIGAH
jgi:hypothetical protein